MAEIRSNDPPFFFTYFCPPKNSRRALEGEGAMVRQLSPLLVEPNLLEPPERASIMHGSKESMPQE